jgi:hypothetical protein
MTGLRVLLRVKAQDKSGESDEYSAERILAIAI